MILYVTVTSGFGPGHRPGECFWFEHYQAGILIKYCVNKLSGIFLLRVLLWYISSLLKTHFWAYGCK
jgi:hypothetical protein